MSQKAKYNKNVNCFNQKLSFLIMLFFSVLTLLPGRFFLLFYIICRCIYVIFMLTLMSKIIVPKVRDEFISQNNSNFPLCQKCSVFFPEKLRIFSFSNCTKTSEKSDPKSPCESEQAAFPFLLLVLF
jgi:hypothetical protein